MIKGEEFYVCALLCIISVFHSPHVFSVFREFQIWSCTMDSCGIDQNLARPSLTDPGDLPAGFD